MRLAPWIFRMILIPLRITLQLNVAHSMTEDEYAAEYWRGRQAQ